MTDQLALAILRLDCLRIAAGLPGDHLGNAKAFYQFVSGETASAVEFTSTAAPAAPAEAPKAKGRPPKAQEPAPVVEPEPEVETPPADEPEATRAVAQALSVGLARAKGREALVALLANHAVGRCGELAEEQLADYCADARERIAS